MTILNFRINHISFDFAWYRDDVFAFFSFKLFERCDPSCMIFFHFQILYFQFSIIEESGL